jgi:peptidoglycan/LPS O-acetylase OafA/YrhL
VPLFFVLSGFLLYRPFARATLHGGEWPSLRRYGRSRVLRIAPAYLLALTVAIVATETWLTPAALAAFAIFLWVRALISRTMLLVPAVASVLAGIAFLGAHDPGRIAWTGMSNYALLFQPLGPYGVIGPAWSLCIEISFYLALPLIALGLHRVARRARTPRARLGRVSAALLVALPSGAIYLSFAGEGRSLPVWLPGYIDQFAIGMLLAVAVEYWSVVPASASRIFLAVAVGIGALAVPLYGVGPLSDKGNGSSVLYAPVMAIAFAFVIASLVMAPAPTLLGRALRTRVVLGLGVISYGVFLWHFPVMDALQMTPLWTSEATNFALVVTLTVALAIASWRLVERRALALKDAPLRRQRVKREPAAAPADGSPAVSSLAAADVA